MAARNYDVIIVGAGLAGSTAALLYARRGLHVALIEKKSSPSDYKKLCTHYLQPNSVPLLQDLGLYEQAMAAGAVPSRIVLHTPWGMVPAPQFGVSHKGLNIRRELLDPIFHHAAVAHPCIDWWGGYKVAALRRDHGYVRGVNIQGDTPELTELSAPLVIGADGRESAIAKMADMTTRTFPNERFSFYRYFRNLEPSPDNNTRVWVLDDGASYVTAFPNNDDLTLVSCYVPERFFDAWRSDVAGHFHAFVARAPGAPDLDRGEPVGGFLGMRKAPTIRRTPSTPGLALIGDAALALDPLVGIGCTWAMESAFMLVKHTAAPLLDGAGNRRLARALHLYRWHHRLYFGPQSSALIPLSRARPYHRSLQWGLRLAGAQPGSPATRG